MLEFIKCFLGTLHHNIPSFTINFLKWCVFVITFLILATIRILELKIFVLSLVIWNIYILKWKSLSHVQLFVIRIKGWVPFTFSRGSSQPRNWTQVSHTAGGLFTSWAQGSPRILTGVGSLSLLQWIFPTQEWNQSLLHCSWFFTNWAIREAP